MTYTALQIIERAQSLGVTIALEQNRLSLRAARPDLISDTMRARVKEYKDALIAYLSMQAVATPPPVKTDDFLICVGCKRKESEDDLCYFFDDLGNVYCSDACRERSLPPEEHPMRVLAQSEDLKRVLRDQEIA